MPSNDQHNDGGQASHTTVAWTTVKHKRHKSGICRRNLINNSVTETDSNSSAATAHIKPRCAFQRGTSNTFDGLDFAKDDTCRTLLGSAKSDSDRLDAVILAALMHPDCTELFSEALQVSSIDEFPAAIKNFAHGSGDLHTGLAVVRERLLGARRTKTQTALPKWCREKYLSIGAMQFVLAYVQDFRELWDYDDEHKDERQTTVDPVLDSLCNFLRRDLCVYSGHSDLGYYKICTEQVIKICPTSSIRLLTEMPKYVVIHPRHRHHTTPGGTCHFMTPVEPDQAEFLINEMCSIEDIFTHFHQVSPVSGFQRTGTECLRRLCTAWNTQSDGLNMKEDLETLCRNDPVILDMNETSKSGYIDIHAYDFHHSTVRSFIKQQIENIKKSLTSEKAELHFPSPDSKFRLIVGRGLECQQVLFPFENFIDNQDSQSQVKITKLNHKVVEINTDVHVSLHIGDLRTLEGKSGVCFDPVLKSGAVIKRLFMYLNEHRWKIEGIHELENGMTEQNLTFHDHVTAGNALERLKGAIKSGIPITVLNEKFAKKEMMSFKLNIDKRVMNVLKKVLVPKIINFYKDNKLKVEYKMFQDGKDNTLIQVVTNHVQHKKAVMEALDRCLEPVRSGRMNRNVSEYFTTEEGIYCMKAIGNQFNCYIHFSTRERMAHIFGENGAKLAGQRALKKYIAGNIPKMLNRRIVPTDDDCHADRTWHKLGRLQLNQRPLPKDLFIKFSQRFLNLSEKFTDAEEAQVDVLDGTVWLLAPINSCYDKNTMRLKALAEECLKEDYDLNLAVSVLVTPGGESDDMCVVCYCTITDTPYVLETCGHIYCPDCFKAQLRNAISNTMLPVTCAGCDAPIAIADFENAIYELNICGKQTLLRAAVRNFVAQHHDTYRPCSALNCQGVTRLNKLLNTIVCGLCSHRICPNCLHRYHPGLTCKEYEASFLSIDKWMKEESNRKVCTSCKMGIEKYDGCNNVLCVYCKKNLCWVCLKVFATSDDCYKHMDETGHWSNQ